MAYGVLFDIDGTLVDSNYVTVVAWADAFESQGYSVPMTKIHALVGQGSGRLIENAIGHYDDAVAEAHDDFYAPRLHSLRAFEGLTVVLATSASEHDARFLRAAVDADDVVDHAATSDDAESSKPDPDIVQAAVDGAGLSVENCVFVGDTIWDVHAANKAGMDCVCVLTGGIAEAELTKAGAVAIYASVAELLDEFDASPLGLLAGKAAADSR
jgi:HAD superfamily hydrolase (TIGR01509 family)